MAALPLSPRSPRSPRVSEEESSVAFPFHHLPPELLAACLACLPLDASARCSCVARAWRSASRAPDTRWLELQLSASATALWIRPLALSRRTVAELLLHAAALSAGAGARSLDLTGHELDCDTSWLYDLLLAEASRPGGGALLRVTAPQVVMWPATAAALCGVLPRLQALTVAVAAAGVETGESLVTALATPALRVSSFTLSSRLVLCPPPEQLAAALAPHAAWLTELDLSASGLRDAHVEALAPLLANAHALQRLDLSENMLTADCIAALVAAVLPDEGSALRVLDLSANKLQQRRAGGPTRFAFTTVLEALTRQHEHALLAPAGRAEKHPLRRLVVQCCAPVAALEHVKEHAAPTDVAFGFGSHTWRLWGAV